MMKSPLRRHAGGAAIALSALLAVSGCGSSAAEETPAETLPAETVTPEAEWPAGDEKGTLENPYSLGEEIVDGDWSLTVNSVNLDANEQFKAMDSFVGQVPPDPGNTWVFINATFSYNGDEPAEGGTMFSIVNENWTGGFMTDDEYGTTFNSVSTLKPGETKAGPVEDGFTVTENAILQMPVEHANESSMVNVEFNNAEYNHFLVKLD